MNLSIISPELCFALANINENSEKVERIACVNLLYKEFNRKIVATDIIEEEDLADVQYIIESFFDELCERESNCIEKISRAEYLTDFEEYDSWEEL